ncbi:hypothetical protein [Paenibacillus dendritiformis]|uniref:hypothetical protein n=1 Tax=Paenibacillus dendritiformis TaxID=130049 RepID=UPI00387E0484
MIAEYNSKRPELKTNQISLSDHAHLRMQERFGIKNKNEAVGKVREWLRESERIGQISCIDGSESVLYAYNKAAIFLTLDLRTVKTVVKIENISLRFKDKVISLHKKELDTLSRLEKSKKKKLKLERLRINVDIAQLEYRAAKTRSKNVRFQCKNQIKSLNEYITNLENELNKIKDQKRDVAKSMVAIL